MAGTAPAANAAANAASPEHTVFAQDILSSINAVGQPVEMHNMASAGAPLAIPDPPIDGLDGTEAKPPGASITQDEAAPSHDAARAGESAAPKPQPAANPSSDATADIITASVPVPSASGAPQPSADEIDDGIGPAIDRPALEAVGSDSGSGLKLVITLLLHSTDTRHPYIIDEGYLQRRNVIVEGGDPSSISVYTLKELIMRDWRPGSFYGQAIATGLTKAEWEAKPSSPTSIRLIHMGRMLEDKWYLKGPTPHIVHMTIKPQEVIDEEDARIAKGGRDSGAARGSCRCVVM